MGFLSHKQGAPLVLTHNIDFTISEEEFLLYLNKIRKSKQERIKRFRFREDALRSLFGELLLKYALESFYNMKYQEEIIFEDEYGKPTLKDYSIYFNISHSGNWAVFAGYISPVGIDIEKVETPPYEIMPKNFTVNEIEHIEKSLSDEKAEKFYTLWTLKESYIKMLGLGLSIPLDSFSINILNKDNIGILDKNRPTDRISFTLSKLDQHHIMAVCLSNFSNDVSLSSVSLSDFKGLS